LCGGDIARRADNIDRNPPQLQRYDAWGNEAPTIIHHPDAIAQKKDIWEEGRMESRHAPTAYSHRPRLRVHVPAQSVGHRMVCSTGMTGGVESRRPVCPAGDPRKGAPRLTSATFDGSWDGAMFMTEIRGGSDLASSECTARAGERDVVPERRQVVLLNVDAKAIATLARPEGAEPGLKTLALFLVPGRALRRDAQRHPHQAPEGQARDPLRANGRDRLRGRRGVSAQ
jgi:hypothetical protein